MSKNEKSNTKSPFAPKKISKATLEKVYKALCILLEKSREEKQLTKKQYKSILDALERQRDGENIKVMTKGVVLNDVQQTEWTVVYNVIDQAFTK